MKVSYKLVKRTTKTEKYEKSLILYIPHSRTILYEVKGLGNIKHAVRIHRLIKSVSSLRLPKEQKKRRKQQIQEKTEREKRRSH